MHLLVPDKLGHELDDPGADPPALQLPGHPLRRHQELSLVSREQEGHIAHNPLL